MKKKLFILFLFSFMYSDFINVMIDFDPSYQMISVDNEGVSSYNFEYVDPGITLGYYSDIYKKELFALGVGGEFMMGRKSKYDEAIFAFHSLYIAPTFVIDDRINVFARIGYSLVNTDTSDDSFNALSNGINIGTGFRVKLTDNYAVAFEYIYHEHDGVLNEVHYDFKYNRYGITLSYGLNLLENIDD